MSEAEKRAAIARSFIEYSSTMVRTASIKDARVEKKEDKSG